MPANTTHDLAKIVNESQAQLLDAWIAHQLAARTRRSDLITEADLRRESADFLSAFRQGLASDDADDVDRPSWAPAREVLADISRSRARQGFTPSETATFILSLKQPLFDAMQSRMSAAGARELAAGLWLITTIIDKLALVTTEAYQKGREEVISRQQHELLELSTPVVKLWDGILALPLIGTLDSERTQVVMESLLQTIVETGASIAIIDITGVPTVDTLVAQHLLKTVAAGRLMGADCIISGIRPQIAATIVHLGVDLSAVITKSSLADAFSLSLSRLGMRVVKTGHTSQEQPRGTDSDT